MKNVPVPKNRILQRSPWRIYLPLGLLMATVLGAIGFSLCSGDKATQTYAPLVNGAMEIKLEAAMGHLWFEEILSGDRHENIQSVWQHLDQSVWYARAMLEGGTNAEGTCIPLQDAELRREIEDVVEKLAQFRDVAEQRYAARDLSAAGTDIDERFDAVFRDVMQEADSVETALQLLMHHERIRFIITQVLLAALCLAVGVFVVVVLRRERAQLISALREVDRQSASRQQALNELQEKEEWFRLSAETAGVAVWEYDLIEDRMARSSNHDQLYGMDPQEVWTSEIFRDALHPDDREVVMRLIDQSLAAGGPDQYQCDYRTIWPDESEHWLSLTGEICKRDSKGVATMMRGCLIDITERNRAEEALRMSEPSIRRKLNAITAPQGDLSSLDLSDIVDPDAMQALLDEVHGITGMCIGIADIKGKVLASVGWRDICLKFHRMNPETAKNCMESDTILSDGVAPGEYKLYHCKNHMWEAASPITIAGEHLGNIFFGQFLYVDEEVDENLFREQARRCGFDEEAYLSALERVPRYDRETAEHAIQFCAQLAGMISTLSFSNIQLARTLAERQQAEETLRREQDLLEEAQRIAHLGVFEFEVTTQTIVWSEEQYRIFGQDPAGAPPTYEKLLREWIPAEDVDLLDKTFMQAIKNQTVYELEHRLLRPDGTVRWVDNHALPCFDEEGELVRYIGVSLDVTDRKQAEDQLRVSENRFRALFQQAGDYCMILNPNTESGVPDIEDVNDAFCAALGRKRDDLIGRSVADIDDPEAKRLCLERTRRIMDGETLQIETSHVRQDGSAFLVAAHANRIDIEGQPPLVYVTEQDITERKQSAEKLKLFSEALENSLNAFDIVNADGLLTYVNESYVKMWGYDNAEEIIGTSPADHCADPEQAGRIIHALRETGKFEGEFVAKRKDGSFFDVLMYARLAHDRKGKMIFPTTSIDITQRKQAEQALRKERRLLKEAQTIAHLGIFEYVVGTQTIVWSEEEYLIFGQDPAGPAPTYDIMLRDLIHPEDVDLMDAAFTQAVQNRSAYEQEHRIIRPDGTVRWISSRALPYIDAQGQLERYIGISLDITELKLAQEEMLKEKARLQFALEVSHMGAWDLNLVDHSSHRTIGHDKVFGYQTLLPEWTYEMFLEHVLPEDRDEVDLNFKHAVHSNADWNFECRIRRADGEVRWIWAIGRPGNVENKDDQLMGGIVQDVTERKQIELELQKSHDQLEVRVQERTAELAGRQKEAETLNRAMINLLEDLKQTNQGLETAKQALRTTNKELEAFSYSVSHDLRAPLRHIDGFVQLLLKREKEKMDATSARYLETIAQSSGRMGHLIDDLLAFSRTSRAEMRFERVDQNDVVQTIVSDLTSLMEDRQIEWEISDLPSVKVDKGLIRQVWANLIGNAVKYTGKRDLARIEIGVGNDELRKDSEEVVFYIRDNGAGFDPQYVDKLFGVFQRLHREDEFEGTGIGLATVRRIVVRHGGRVWAEGQVDQGATFYFSLKQTQGAE